MRLWGVLYSFFWTVRQKDSANETFKAEAVRSGAMLRKGHPVSTLER
ncbi:hypothetical protein CEV33_0619 [Brucella grignonensis]|uniref:Uncharacterized protein n=1 Tax=Brucella grignonensis TaxID=94627 RepID=A0A256FH80_9HYPH|nr:hypothetical protein CEV33_0619 [Brucella grignonensis]